MWIAATNLFDNKLYKLAVRCFAQADDRAGMLMALGYQLYEESTKIEPGKEQQERLLRAAAAFDGAGDRPKAGACLGAAAEYRLSAVAWESLGMVEKAAKVLAKGAEVRAQTIASQSHDGTLIIVSRTSQATMGY